MIITLIKLDFKRRIKDTFNNIFAPKTHFKSDRNIYRMLKDQRVNLC